MLFDYAGGAVSVVDWETGEVRQALAFVAVLRGSSYTYAEATWMQGAFDWVSTHVVFRQGKLPEKIV
jgi:transposase